MFQQALRIFSNEVIDFVARQCAKHGQAGRADAEGSGHADLERHHADRIGAGSSIYDETVAALPGSKKHCIARRLGYSCERVFTNFPEVELACREHSEFVNLAPSRYCLPFSLRTTSPSAIRQDNIR